jgi:hypothetical protein
VANNHPTDSQRPLGALLEKLALAKRDPEIVACDRRARKEEEVEDIEVFVDAYERATGEKLEIEEVDESPDAICRRPDGSLVGVEHTRIRAFADRPRRRTGHRFSIIKTK